MLRFCLPLALLVILGCVSAQGTQLWTLQSAAFADAEQAAGVVSQLRSSGFDAYAERSGEITRVRVGCFLDRTSAEDVALTLAQQSDVQVVPLNAGARVTFCIHREAGFLLPEAWGVVENTPRDITFWVDAAGRRYLRYNERGWQVYQNAAAAVVSELAADLSTASEQRTPFRVNSLFVGSGQPLWRSKNDRRQTLVVQGEASIFTLTLLPPDDSSEASSLSERSE